MTQQIENPPQNQVPPEIQQAKSAIENMDVEEAKKFATVLSIILKAFHGQDPDPDTIIQYMTDLKVINERSRFPTYPLVRLQVYLRLLGYMIPEAEGCLDWADEEAHTMISYKGGSREEFKDIKKAAPPPQGQDIYFGAPNSQGQIQPQQQKRSFWSRKPTTPESEFHET